MSYYNEFCDMAYLKYLMIFIPLLLGTGLVLENSDIKVITGSWADAQKASYKPDASNIGVYMIVDKGFKYTADELIPPLKTYFDHYDLPVIFVKQSNPTDKDMCSIRIFCNGKSIEGNLSNGNFSLLRIEKDHNNIFTQIQRIYEKANL